MQKAKKIIVSVSNDISTDQRVHKVCTSLHEAGYEVLLLGRKLHDSLALSDRAYRCVRFSLWFNRGALFYANLNLRLFFYLLFQKKDMLLANDLDTLPANFLAGRLQSKVLIYDSHEYFTEVPELINRPFQKKFWEKIEAFMLPKLKKASTVSQLIANAYFKKYGLRMALIRNFPKRHETIKSPKEGNVLIYQGALNIGRGLPELIKAMPMVKEGELLLAGTGDIEGELKKLVFDLKLQERVKFLGRVNPNELMEITQKARLGFSIERDLGLNYRYAVPNKIFDYIQAGTPVLYSPLPEVMDLLSDYKIGEFLQSHNPEQLADQINRMLKSDNYSLWIEECQRAASVFTWEKEEETLLKLVQS